VAVLRGGETRRMVFTDALRGDGTVDRHIVINDYANTERCHAREKFGWNSNDPIGPRDDVTLQQRQERLKRRIVMRDLVYLDEAHDVPVDHVPYAIARMQTKRFSHGFRNRSLRACPELAGRRVVHILLSSRWKHSAAYVGT
jgi:hypothetical protein